VSNQVRLFPASTIPVGSVVILPILLDKIVAFKIFRVEHNVPKIGDVTWYGEDPKEITLKWAQRIQVVSLPTDKPK
jgi:hypothetical protein